MWKVCHEELGSTRGAAYILLYFPTLPCSVNSVAITPCLLSWEKCFCLHKNCHEQDASSLFLSNVFFSIFKGTVQTAPHQPCCLLYPEHIWWKWWEILCTFAILSLWTIWKKSSTECHKRHSGGAWPRVPWFCWISNSTSIPCPPWVAILGNHPVYPQLTEFSSWCHPFLNPCDFVTTTYKVINKDSLWHHRS